jgi:hypothetical protein
VFLTHIGGNLMSQPDSNSGLRRWLWILALLLLLLLIGILYLLLNRPTCPACPVTVVTATQVAMEPSDTPTALPITPTATATPTPATPEEPTPEIIDGNTGEREGGGTGVDDSLPPKGDEVPPLDGDGTKPEAGEVQPGDTTDLVDRYGDEAKPEGQQLPGTSGGIPMAPNPLPPATGRYAQLSFTMTETDVRPDVMQTLPGTLPISPILRGEILYVVYAQGEEQPIFVGTFFDPLVAYGTIQDDRGHSVTQFESGSAIISLPVELTDPAAMVQATIAFYRLDPSLQDSTVVSIDNLGVLLENATLISRLAAENLIPLLRQEG